MEATHGCGTLHGKTLFRARWGHVLPFTMVLRLAQHSNNSPCACTAHKQHKCTQSRHTKKTWTGPRSNGGKPYPGPALTRPKSGPAGFHMNRCWTGRTYAMFLSPCWVRGKDHVCWRTNLRPFNHGTSTSHASQPNLTAGCATLFTQTHIRA